MSFTILLGAGFIAGLLVGSIFANSKLGCTALFIIPAGMIGYVAARHHLNPEQLRSTSGLDFIFAPLWASIGAFGGFAIAKAAKEVTGGK